MDKRDKPKIEVYSPSPWEHLRFEVFKRDNFVCQYCGWSKKQGGENHLEVDHIKPRAEGGRDELLNLTTSCRKCNAGKWYITLADKMIPFFKYLRPMIALKRRKLKLLKELYKIESDIEELESGKKSIERRLERIKK